MSVFISSKAWKVGGLSPTEKIILLRLSDHADSDHRCWPSLKNISDHCGCSTRTVSRAILKFENIGILTHNRRYNKSNVYQFNIDTMSSLAFNEDTVSSPMKTPCLIPIDTMSSLGVPMKTPCLVNEDTHVSLTIKNHKEKEDKRSANKSSALDSNQQVDLVGTETKPIWHGWTGMDGRKLLREPKQGTMIRNPKTGEIKEY